MPTQPFELRSATLEIRQPTTTRDVFPGSSSSAFRASNAGAAKARRRGAYAATFALYLSGDVAHSRALADDLAKNLIFLSGS